LSSESVEVDLDLASLSGSEVNDRIKRLSMMASAPKRLRLYGAHHQHNLLTAVPSLPTIVEGNVGDYCAAALREADIEIHGSTGTGVGHSLQSGVISVHGNVGPAAGAMATGGLIVIHGNAGQRCGAGLQGADIVVKGSVDSHAGVYMRDGTLVILGDVGPQAGLGASAGTWFVMGGLSGQANCLIEARMKEPDKLRLGLLLLNSGIDANAKDFRKYVIETPVAQA
jgi:glutamate synthase domain-containing protein 3